MSDDRGKTDGRAPGDSDIAAEMIDPGIMSELVAATRLLEKFKREFNASDKSPRFLILDHCIQCCNAYLETLINEEHHIQLARNAHRYGASLKSELNSYMAMLENPPGPDGGGDHAETRERNSATPARPADTIGNIAKFIRDKPLRSSLEEAEVSAGSNPATGGAEAPPVLSICMLGEFRAYLNGRKIDCWPKGKSKLLFKYLATFGNKPVPKEKIMEVFWPEHDEQSARNNLNVAIYSLRQSLKKRLPSISAVLFRDGCYLINPEISLWVDSAELEACVKKAIKHESRKEFEPMMRALRRAEELYAGTYLSEDAYCDWVVEKQIQYQDIYLMVLDKLDRCYRRKGDFDGSIAINKKILEIDNCNERAHLHLMEDYVELGQRHLALKQYELCEHILRRELDLEPDQSLIKLFHRIKETKIA